MRFEKGNTYGTANKGNKRPGASEFWRKWNAEEHELTAAQIEARKKNARIAIAARVAKHRHRLSNIDFENRIGDCKQCGLVPLKVSQHKSRTRQDTQYICWVGSISRNGGPTIEVEYSGQALDLWRKQNGLCDICQRQIFPGNGLSDDSATLDHCHTTGRVRAWLCQPCNKGIGHFKENPELMKLAVRYLEEKCNSPLRS